MISQQTSGEGSAPPAFEESENSRQRDHPQESPEAVLTLAPRTAKTSVGLNPSVGGGDMQGIRSQK